MNLRVPPVLPFTLTLTLTAVLSGAAAHATSGERFAVVIGNNMGAAEDAALRFAEDDAQKTADALVRVGGFAQSDVITLRGAKLDETRRTLIDVNDRVRQSRAALLVVYYSGHADAESLHFGDERLPLTELEQLVRGSAARFRVLVLDACRSGVLTATKGAKPAQEFTLPASTSSASRTEGYVVLTAAAAGEDAQESELLRGSFFTHHFVSGLLGAADVDEDLQVTLEEAYRYAFQNTVRASSATIVGTQHPTFRYDVRGRGDVTLASLAGARARQGVLRFPAGVTFLVFARDGRVVGEVSAANATARALFVPPGRYDIRGRARDVVYDGTVEVSAAQQRDIDLGSMTRTAYARLVRKGGSDGEGYGKLFTSGPVASYVQHQPWIAGESDCVGVSIAWVFHLRYLDVGPRAHACANGFANERIAATQNEVVGELVLSHVFDFPFVSMQVGAMLGYVGVSQKFATLGVAPPRFAQGLTGGITTGVVVDLPAGFFLAGDVEGRTAVLPFRVDRSTSAVGTPAVVGWHLGAGFQF